MKQSYELASTFDDPIVYEKKQMDGKISSISFYPVKLRDIYKFDFLSDVLLVEKNTLSKDPNEAIKLITMSYLDFYLQYSNDENLYLSKLYWLLKLCLNKSEISNEEFPIEFGKTKDEKSMILIGDGLYDSSDFEEFRLIMAEQNLLEFEDESIQKELRDKLKEAEAYRNKAQSNGTKPGSLEDLMICAFISAPFRGMDDVYNLSIRKFRKILERIDVKLHYQIYATASMSGMVEFKDKSVLKHWMSDLKKKPYESAMMDSDKFKSGLKEIL
jgi:hypothetical protein